MATTFCRHVYLSWTFHVGVEGTYFTVQQLWLKTQLQVDRETIIKTDKKQSMFSDFQS